MIDTTSQTVALNQILGDLKLGRMLRNNEFNSTIHLGYYIFTLAAITANSLIDIPCGHKFLVSMPYKKNATAPASTAAAPKPETLPAAPVYATTL